MAETGNKSIISDLWARRVPQFVATYIGICWGVLQFLIFASNRYNINENFIDKFLIFAVVLIPGVFIFIYNHGRPGKDRWKNYEKILLPVNFILALVFAGMFTGGNELNASPVEVQVTNESGDTIIRHIPANSTTKSFAVFPLLNEDNDEKTDWMKFILARMLQRDLEQDMRMYCLSPYNLDYAYKSHNISITDNDVPLSKYINIARDKIVDYFITGSYSYKEGKLTGKIQVYETKNGELFFEEVFEDKDMFVTIDDFSKNMTSNLFLDDSGEKILVTDLPVSELLSNNLDALEQMTIALNMAKLNGDVLNALPYINKAAELDPESPMILAEQASYLYSTGAIDTSVVVIEKAIRFSESLPERQKFAIRQQYYIYKKQMDKNVALLETWRQLYPRDYYPYNQLISFYSTTQVVNKAKEVAEDALANGHGDRVLKRLAGFEITQGNYEKAERYINQYYDTYPDKNKLEDLQLADIYMKKGEYDKAQKWYEQILLFNPNDHKILDKLSDVYLFKGDFDKAESTLYEALEACTLAEDSLSIYSSLIKHYFRTGEVDKFLAVAKTHFDKASPEPKISSAFQHLQMSAIYVMFSQEERIEEIGQLIEEKAPQFLSTFDCVADFIVTLVKEDKDGFTEAYTGFCKDIILRGTPTMTYLADGFIAKMNGDYKDAIRLFETYVDTTGQNGDNFASWISECYRLDGQVKKAIEYCETTLNNVPFEGNTMVELAKAYYADGQVKKAKELVKKLKTEVWKNSDERFTLYKILLDFEAELNS